MKCEQCKDAGIVSKPGKISRVCKCQILPINPIILFRSSLEVEDEFKICKETLPTTQYRSQIPSNSLVIPRYSALPFYQELEKEVLLRGSKLINSYDQHDYVADIRNYYYDLTNFTPKTRFNWHRLPEGQYILKGRTNSRKHQWCHQMFVPTAQDVPKIAARLLDDTFIRDQGLCVRDYIPLRQFGIGINKLPITNEWRIFFLGTEIIDYGFYWSSHPQYKPTDDPPQKMFDIANKIATIVSKHINFWVVDMAETEDGDWIMIELNDGSMSGLSDINPTTFYKSLAEKIDNQNLQF